METPAQLGPRARRRRERILEAASTLFARQGIERTRVDDLLEEAGIARATFYRAFSSLDEVVEALYLQYQRQVVERLAESLSHVGERGLGAVVDGVLDEHAERGAWIRAMYREELRPGRTMQSQHKRVGAQTELIGRWWQESTGKPADNGLIVCLILLMQAGGLYSQELPEGEREQLRDALMRVMAAVIASYDP